MKGALDLLLALTEISPPEGGVNHHLVPSDGRLMVGVWLGKHLGYYVLDEADMKKEPRELANELLSTITARVAGGGVTI